MATPSQTIILITGANTGIGYSLARNLLLSSPTNHILLCSRSRTRGLAALESLNALPLLGTVSLLELDVTDDNSIAAAVQHVETEYGHLDILVNNAATSCQGAKVPREVFREVLEVNLMSPVYVTEAFLPLLKASPSPHPRRRLIFLHSSTGSLTHASDPSSPYYKPTGLEYKSSKAGLSMVIALYTQRLAGEGILVFGADPGLNATNLTGDAEALRKRGAEEPEVGGERVAAVVRGERDEDVGRICGVYGVSPW